MAGDGGAGDGGASDGVAGNNGDECKYGQFVQIWTIKKRKRRQEAICIFLPKQI